MKKLFLLIAMLMICFAVMISASASDGISEDHEHVYDCSTWTTGGYYECEKYGESTYTCVCGNSYSVPIVALGHQDNDLDGDCDYCNGIFAGDYIYKYVKNDENNDYIFCDESQPSIGIYRYIGNAINLEVPEKIDGLTVVKIGDEAFRDNLIIDSIKLPSTIRVIETLAFADCRSLKSVIFEENSQLEKIGSGAFGFCTSLNNIILASGVTYIGSTAFEACISLEEINLPGNLTFIGYSAFASCIKLKNIIIPSSVIEIQDTIFGNCTSLESADIKASISRLPEAMFAFCYSLKTVTLSATIDTIGSQAFLGCFELDYNTLIKNIKCIEAAAFGLCNSNTSIVITDPDIVLGESSLGHIASKSYDEIYKRFIDLQVEFMLCENDEEKQAEIDAEIAEIEVQLKNGTPEKYTIYGYSGSTAETYVAENNAYGNLKFVDLEAECMHTGGKATCEEKAVCELCGEEYGEFGDHIPATHRQNPPSCMINGFILISCEICLENLGYEIITAPGHIPGEAVTENEIKATCESSGNYDEVLYCTECSTEISRNRVTVDPLDHNWDNGSVTTVATCNVKEVKAYTCKNNSTHTKEVVGTTNSNNHIGTTYLVGEKNADCTQGGYTGDIYCSDCNKKLSSGSTTPISEHTFGSWKTDKAATFLEEGLKIRTCTKCTETETEIIPRVKGEESKDENSGITVEYTDDSYDGKEIDVQVEEDFTGSQYIGQSKYGRTESWNIKTYIDGIEVQPNTPVLVKIPLPEGFDPNKVVIYHVNSIDGTLEKITPVYVEDGYIKFIASSFSVYILVDESSKIEPPHEHSYTSTVTKNPTCTEAGVKTFTCSCSDSYTESIPALGHKDANGDYKCDNGCGYEYEKPAPEQPEDPSKDCSCNCHKGGFMGFIWKIINFFQKLFKSNQLCKCGVKHY